MTTEHPILALISLDELTLVCLVFCRFFRCFSTKNVKDELPDTWDEEELPEGQEEKEDNEILRRKDKDLDFLLQEVSRNSSLDDRLKRDLQEKKSDPKYKEMLVSS